MDKKDGLPAVLKKKLIICCVVIASVLLIAAAGIGIWCITRSSDNGYFIDYNGKKYTLDEVPEAITLTGGETYVFSVKSDTGKIVEYTAQVTPNPERNFSFRIGEEVHWFYDPEGSRNDYSEIFGLNQTEEKVTITLPERFSLKAALEKQYGETLEVEDDEDLEAGCYFRLVITISASEFVMDLDVESSSEKPITGIELDPPWITF